MEVPDFLHQRVSELLAIEAGTAVQKSMMANVLGLAPYLDGDHWCVLYGPDIQSGVCGFGKSPDLAVRDFDRAWYATTAQGGSDE